MFPSRLISYVVDSLDYFLSLSARVVTRMHFVRNSSLFIFVVGVSACIHYVVFHKDRRHNFDAVHSDRSPTFGLFVV